MAARLFPLTQEHLGVVHPRAARSVFWELEPAAADNVRRAGDPVFEKEAWLSTTILNYGCCGYSIATHSPNDPDRSRKVLGTLLYCGRDSAPGSQQLPTAPVSEDTELITSLFLEPQHAEDGMASVLLDAAIMELVRKDASAVEAFGLREDYIEDPGSPMPAAVRDIVERSGEIGLLSVGNLEAAGFEVIRDHPVLPRLRMELPPTSSVLTAAAVEELLARTQ